MLLISYNNRLYIDPFVKAMFDLFFFIYKNDKKLNSLTWHNKIQYLSMNVFDNTI